MSTNSTDVSKNGTTSKTNLAVMEKNIADNVLNRVNEFTKVGALNLPTDYSVANALKFAFLQISQTEDKSGKSVIESCTKESVANALLEMAIQGLNPMKKQCYFIVYGNKLTMQRSYQGSIAVAKRYSPELRNVRANVIYKDDVFEYSVDANGSKKIIKHEQSLKNIDFNNIIGAYAVTEYSDGTKDLEAMTIAQIKKAWLQGFGGGNTKAHQNFTDEMCCKTVINRACKKIINNSSDSAILGDVPLDNEITTTVEAEVIEEIKSEANKTEITVEEAPGENQAAIQEAKPGF